MLAEDERYQRLIRHYLYRLEYTQHDIRFEPLPAGRGCGEKWVRDRYVREVNVYRERTARAKTVLIVAIDADTQDVDWRKHQLQEALDLAA